MIKFFKITGWILIGIFAIFFLCFAYIALTGGDVNQIIHYDKLAKHLRIVGITGLIFQFLGSFDD